MSRVALTGVLTLLLVACASAPRTASSAFWRQWQGIHPGLSVAEVHARLGPPYTSYEPTDAPGRTMEYWLFAKPDLTVVPPANSFQVLFDKHGRVERAEGPASTRR